MEEPGVWHMLYMMGSCPAV